MISLSIAFVDNSYTGLTKLWCLTNPTANANTVLILILIAIKKKNTLVTYMMFSGIAATASLLPLSNTFFAIHPPLLMLGVCMCLLRLNKPQSNWWVSLLTLGFAMILGGFWSMQELNWGGWWNWDVLELGSLVAWIVAIVGLHGLHTSRALFAWSVKFTSAAMAFYFLNKTGIGVSIHSFVTSNVIRLNYSALLTLLSLLILSISKQSCVSVLLCSLVYTSLIDAKVLKQVTIVVLWWLVAPNSWQRPLHVIALIGSLAALIFNSYNIPLTGAAYTTAVVNYVSTNSVLQLGHRDIQIIYSTGWRSKPLLTYGVNFRSSYLRSPSGRSRWAAYAK